MLFIYFRTYMSVLLRCFSTLSFSTLSFRTLSFSTLSFSTVYNKQGQRPCLLYTVTSCLCPAPCTCPGSWRKMKLIKLELSRCDTQTTWLRPTRHQTDTNCNHDNSVWSVIGGWSGPCRKWTQTGPERAVTSDLPVDTDMTAGGALTERWTGECHYFSLPAEEAAEQRDHVQSSPPTASL